MGKLSIEVRKRGDWEFLILKGSIAEGVEEDLEELVNTSGEHCVLDFAAINSINSCGIAEWLQFIKPFCANRTVIFDNVFPEVLRVINMIRSFRDKATIRSVCAPFRCPDCNHEQIERYIAGENMPESSGVSLTVECKKCQEDMEPTVLEHELFGFLDEDY